MFKRKYFFHNDGDDSILIQNCIKHICVYKRAAKSGKSFFEGQILGSGKKDEEQLKIMKTSRNL